MLEISLDEDCERKQERKKRTTQWNYTGKHTEKEGSGKYQKNLGRKKIKIKEEKPTSYRVPMVLNNHRWTHLLRTLHDSSWSLQHAVLKSLSAMQKTHLSKCRRSHVPLINKTTTGSEMFLNNQDYLRTRSLKEKEISCAERTSYKPDGQAGFDFVLSYQRSSNRGLCPLHWPKSKAELLPGCPHFCISKH